MDMIPYCTFSAVKSIIDQNHCYTDTIMVEKEFYEPVEEVTGGRVLAFYYRSKISP